MSVQAAQGEHLPGGTVTFLFSDVDGSTRLVTALGERYGEVHVAHQQLLRAAFAEAGGREIDTQGDAFFIVFTRARDAVVAAVAGQRALARHQWPGRVAVRVRMGLHTAEPAAMHDRYIGLGVHRAARVCSAGHGGQVLPSGATFAVLADDVVPNIGFVDLGEHRLKDLDRPERIYQLVIPDLPRVFPPLNTVPLAESGTGALPPARTFPTVDGRMLRVVVADDSVLIRDGLSRLLEDAGFDVTGRAADANGLLLEVGRVGADVAITDIKTPPTHVDEGLVAAGEIRRLYPDVGVLVLSQYLDSGYALRLIENYPARVGYLLKDRVMDVAVLGDAIRRIAEGECIVDPTIVSRLMNGTRRREPVAALSARERTILALVAEGRSDEAITEQLDLTPTSLEVALRGVFEKLGLSATLDEVRRVARVLGYLGSTPVAPSNTGRRAQPRLDFGP